MKETKKAKEKRISGMIDKGREALEKGDFANAEKIFRDVESESPILGALWLIRLFASMKREQEALDLLARYKDEKDEKLAVIMFVEEVNLYLQLNQPERAIKRIRERFADREVNIPNTLLATLYLKLRQNEKAEYYALKAVDANEPNARMTLGDIYFALDKYQGAYEQFMQSYPEEHRLAYKVASSLMMLGRPAEAIPFFQEALRQGEYIAAVRLASSYVVLGQFKRAADMAETAIVCGFTQADFVAAKAYKELGDYEKALKHYEKSCDNDMITDGMFTEIAECYIKLEKYYEANMVLDKAVKNKEKGVWHLRGLIYRKLGSDAQALRSFRKSLEVEPELALLASYEIGKIYYQRHELKKAQQYFQDSWSGGYPEGGVSLGDCAYFQEKFERAAVWYQNALDKGCEEAMYPLAHALRQLNQLDKARELFQQCIEKNDDRAHIGLALVAAARGEYEEADEEFGISVEKGLHGVNACYGRFLLERGDFFGAVTYLEKAWLNDHLMWFLPYLVRALFKAGKPLHNMTKINKYVNACKDHGIPIDGLLEDGDDDMEKCIKNVNESNLKHYRDLKNYDE